MKGEPSVRWRISLAIDEVVNYLPYEALWNAAWKSPVPLLVTRKGMLLLDEPAGGTNPEELEALNAVY